MALRRIGGYGKPRRKASEANRNKKPCLATLLTLVSLAAAFHRRTIIVGQKKVISKLPTNAGVGFGPIARSTLNRKLAALERLGYINRTCRHYPLKSGKWKYRKTMFTFGLAAIEFIKQLRRAVRIPLGRLAVPFSGHNQKDYLKLSGLQGAVDKSRVTPLRAIETPAQKRAEVTVDPRKARGDHRVAGRTKTAR